MLTGNGSGCGSTSIGYPSVTPSPVTSSLYLDVYRKYVADCQSVFMNESDTAFRVVDCVKDAELYLDVYKKYSRVSGKFPVSHPVVYLSDVASSLLPSVAADDTGDADLHTHISEYGNDQPDILDAGGRVHIRSCQAGCVPCQPSLSSCVTMPVSQHEAGHLSSIAADEFASVLYISYF